jgi:uncharacterized HAD superfamily protein
LFEAHLLFEERKHKQLNIVNKGCKNNISQIRAQEVNLFLSDSLPNLKKKVIQVFELLTASHVPKILLSQEVEL